MLGPKLAPLHVFFFIYNNEKTIIELKIRPSSIILWFHFVDMLCLHGDRKFQSCPKFVHVTRTGSFFNIYMYKDKTNWDRFKIDFFISSFLFL